MGDIARRLRGLAVASWCLGVSSTAMAQDPSPDEAVSVTSSGEVVAPAAPAAEDRVRLSLRGEEPGLSYTLYPLRPRDAAPLATCGEGCQLELPRGRYRIEVAGRPGSDVHTDSREVAITRDSTLEVDPASKSGRRTGLAMGITGAVLIPIGLTTLMVGALIEIFDSVKIYDDCDPYTDVCTSTRGDDPITPVIWVGLGMFAAGAVLTPVGWVRFARSRKPRFTDATGSHAAGFSPSQPWLGPRRIGSGYGMGAGFRF